MHSTIVKMKDGRELKGPIWNFRPQDGYIEIAGVMEDGELLRLEIADIESAVTPNERVGIGRIADQDELERARKYVEDGKKYGWFLAR